MPYGFEVFIDESGDEGFRFRQRPQSGSSEWLVLSAVMVPLDTIPEMLDMMRELRRIFGRGPSYTLHFADLNHEQRIAWIDGISSIKKLRVASVIIHKPTLMKRALFREKDRLYFYASRFLIERISWFCRDYHKLFPQRDGTPLIVFSKRKSMKYEHLRSYLATLNMAMPPGDDWLKFLKAGIRIHWPSIRIDQVESAPHSARAGLQVADAVASGIKQALEFSRYGYTENRFAKTLRPITYSLPTKKNGGRNYLSYGLKFFPSWPKGESRCSWIERHFMK